MQIYIRIRTLFLVGIALLAGCHSPSEKKGNYLHINFATEPLTVDPRKGTDVPSSVFHFMLYEGLTRTTPRSTSDYGVAERIEISEDKKTYTFHLRNACWNDGHPVVAEDFAYAWKTMLDPLFPCPNCNLLYPIKNAEAIKSGLLPVSQAGITPLDDKTLVIELEAPTPYFLELTAFCVLFPVPSHIAKTNPSWAKNTDQVVGNGPYTLKEWKHWDGMELTRSSTYWDRANVAQDGLVVSIVDNQNTAMQMFERGDLDLMGTPAFTTIPSDAVPFLKEKGTLKEFPVAATTFCAFNVQSFPFTNLKMRKAFSYAINRRTIVDNITMLGEEPALALIPSVLRGTPQQRLIDESDIEQARRLFNEALEEMHVSKEALDSLTFVYRISDINNKLAQELQQQWFQAFGVRVQLQSLENKVYLDTIQKKNYTVALACFYAQYNDPMNVFERFKHAENTKNHPGWENAEYIDAVSHALHATNETERRRYMDQAECILIENAPLAPIYHWHTSFVQQPHIDNIYVSPIGAIHLPSVTIKKRK